MGLLDFYLCRFRLLSRKNWVHLQILAIKFIPCSWNNIFKVVLIIIYHIHKPTIKIECMCLYTWIFKINFFIYFISWLLFPLCVLGKVNGVIRACCKRIPLYPFNQPCLCYQGLKVDLAKQLFMASGCFEDCMNNARNIAVVNYNYHWYHICIEWCKRTGRKSLCNKS